MNGATHSSSSSTCSRPTFCPRECLADVPHTMADVSAYSQNFTRKAREGEPKRQLTSPELLDDLLVDCITEILDCAFTSTKNDGGRVVWGLAAGFGVAVVSDLSLLISRPGNGV